MANQNPLSDRDWLKVKQQFRRYVRREEYKATLADENGVIDEPGYPGYVRVRYSQQEGNLSQPTTLPFEANMVKRVGAAVIVGYDDNGDLAVLRADVATQRTQGINTLDNNSSDPNVTYYIEQQRIITLNSHPISSASDSMVVTIQNWFWIKDGVANYFTGGDGNETPIDLTSYIPGSANQECLACLFIKPDNTVEVIASTPKSAAIGVDIDDVQECLNNSTLDSSGVWSWRLYHGQTGITPGDVLSGGDDFLDLRQIVSVSNGIRTATLQTTDNTQTTIASIPVTELQMMTIKATVNGTKSDYTASCGGTLTAVVRRASGGDVTLVGSVTTDIHEDSAGSPTFTLDVDTGTETARIRVTGISVESWSWVVKYEVLKS